MFKVQIDENEYEVTFHHFPRSFLNPGTDCKIYNVDNKWEVYGETNLHPKDNYCKNIGRKMSLARALKQASTYDIVNGQRIGRPFNKDERMIFWKEYFNVRGGKIN